MYIVFQDKIEGTGDGPEVVRLDDLAKVEQRHNAIYYRPRNSKTEQMLAWGLHGGGWGIFYQSDKWTGYRSFRLGYDVDRVAALTAIASGLHDADECRSIAERALG